MEWGKIALAILTAICMVLIFPSFNLSWLAWIALVPLWFALRRSDMKDSFKLGFLAGLVYFSSTLYWVVIAIESNGQSKFLALFCLFLLSAYLAVYFGLFCLGYRYVLNNGKSALVELVFAPSLWVSLEFLRGFLFSGFPWILLGYSQWKFSPLIQIAEFTGAYGVSFLIVLVNGAIVAGMMELVPSGNVKTKMSRAILPLGVAFLVFLFSTLYGFVTLRADSHVRHGIKVAVLQGNIDQYMKWDKKYEETIKEAYAELVQKVSSERPQLIVWPETAIPGYLRWDKTLQGWLTKVIMSSDAYHIVGSPDYRDRRYYNAAFLVSPRGEIVSEYYKMHLVPFGEMVPLRPVLSHFVRVLNELGDFSPGGERKLLVTPYGNFVMLICWESIFPNLVRRSVKDGGDFIANITNDAWFLKTAAPFQHFVANVFRAVENRISVVRAANTGISGFIDEYGRIISKTEIFVREAQICSLSARKRKTFYTGYGDVFAYLCGGVSVFFFARRLMC